MKACDDADVYEVRWVEHKKPIERLLAQFFGGARSLLAHLVWSETRRSKRTMSKFRALVVEKSADGQFSRRVTERSTSTRFRRATF